MILNDLIIKVPLPARVLGDESITVEGIAPIDNSREGMLHFLSSDHEKLQDDLRGLPAGTIVVCRPSAEAMNISSLRLTLILADQPRLWFAFASNLLLEQKIIATRSDKSEISDRSVLGKNCRIDAFSFIDNDVIIGNNCIIGVGARIFAQTIIGDDVRIGSNAVIGSDGLAAERDLQGRLVNIPHIAGVQIGPGTRIGPNSTIARGSLRDTKIGNHCLIGAGVSIGHNCSVENHVFIAPGAMIAGSAKVGSYSWISMGVAISQKVQIGARAMVGMASVVTRNVSEDGFVAGNPARPLPKINSFNK